MAANNSIKTVVNIPEWAEYFHQAGSVTSQTAAYSMVPLVYRCVKLISDSLASVQLKCYQGEGDDKVEKDWPWPGLDASEWTRKTVLALLISGASYSVILRNQFQDGKGLQWVNPNTIVPLSSTVDKWGNPVIFFQQTPNATGGKANIWPPEQMLYIREFNPVDEVQPGPSPTKVSLSDAGLIRYLTRFASYYFEQGAMPLTILSIDRNTPDAEVKRVEGVFKTMYTGIQKAWKVIALRGGKDSAPYTLTPALKDLVITELHEQARRAVAGAFGIPQTMLEDAANYATAENHTMQFWTTCIRPRGAQITAALNEQVGRQMGLTFEYAFEELDIFQADEAARADSLKKLVGAGLPLLMAMDTLGYELDADQRAQLEQIEADKKRAAEELRQALANKPAQDEEKPEDKPQQMDDPGMTDMMKWQKKAVKAVKRGEAADVEFSSEHIPDAVQAAIHAKLAGCAAVEDVRAVFDKGRESEAVDIAEELKRANDLLERIA